MIDPDRPCPHDDFDAMVAVARLTDAEHGPVTAYKAEIRVWCRDCTEPFRFIGVPCGALSDRPTCSLDEKELSTPIRPASSDPDFGLGIPGFTVQVRESR